MNKNTTITILSISLSIQINHIYKWLNNLLKFDLIYSQLIRLT